MEIILSLDHYSRFISSEGVNKTFTPNQIDEHSYPSGVIDVFDVIGKLQGIGLIGEVSENSVLNILPGENRSIIIGSNDNFKNINSINVQGHGKRIQIIRIDGFKGPVHITHCKPLDLIDLQNNFGKIILENDMQVHKIRISGEGDGFECRNLQILNEFLINGANIEHNLIVENIEFFTDDTNSRFEIYGSKIQKLSITKSVFPINGLTISNSIISEVYFYRINLEKLNLIGVTGTGFGNLIKCKNEFSEMKEFYRQLKHSHDEIGNKTEANKFFAKEMEYYEKSLSWKTEGDKKFISFIQRFSNNYGNSWLRPSFWIVFVSFLYTFSFDCWSFHCSCGGVQDWTCFSDHWLKNVSQFPTELKNAKDWWFFGYAIIMGSLIYQLLVALRRISQR